MSLVVGAGVLAAALCDESRAQGIEEFEAVEAEAYEHVVVPCAILIVRSDVGGEIDRSHPRVLDLLRREKADGYPIRSRVVAEVMGPFGFMYDSLEARQIAHRQHAARCYRIAYGVDR